MVCLTRPRAHAHFCAGRPPQAIDTPDGKPTAEWLMFRKHKLFTTPLEQAEEDGWVSKLQDPFDEVLLHRGRLADYKRPTAGVLGLVKCFIRTYRKEDQNEQGKSLRSLGKQVGRCEWGRERERAGQEPAL